MEFKKMTLVDVKEKKAELEKLKSSFVRRASEFLRNYFASLVDFMINDKSYFSQRGQLKRPDHADLRYKCRTYARLLQHLKSLDKNCLGPLRKAYCASLNLLLRREAREFANELRASTKASRNPTVWLDAAGGAGQNVGNADTSAVSDAYAKMLTIFVPLLVDESSFFAHFMCFEVPALNPPGSLPNGNKSTSNDDDTDDDDLGIMDIDDNNTKAGITSAELIALNECLQELLDGIQEDFYAVVDWAYKIDPLRCISMHGITERYLSGQKADAAGFVRLLLGDLESRISMQFNRFVDEACHQIERNERNVRQMGVLSYIPRFATLATRMEQYIQGQSRDLVDQAYTKFVSVMFGTLEKIAQSDPKYADVFLLENYAAFQNSLYDLANVVPTLAKFYHQASEAYEQACTRYITMIIYYVSMPAFIGGAITDYLFCTFSLILMLLGICKIKPDSFKWSQQFERLFQFARRIEDLMYTITPEEIPFQLGLSKTDLRKVLKASLSGVDKSIQQMYKRLQKNLTSEELLPSLWDKCKKDFLDKYESFAQLVAKVYATENIPASPLLKYVILIIALLDLFMIIQWQVAFARLAKFCMSICMLSKFQISACEKIFVQLVRKSSFPFARVVLSYILGQTIPSVKTLGRYDFVLMVSIPLTRNCKIWFLVRGLNRRAVVVTNLISTGNASLLMDVMQIIIYAREFILSGHVSDRARVSESRTKKQVNNSRDQSKAEFS
ncbi:LOW QUALITY PROTEIN: hypothetical protein Cgig2_000355 [Carnegiea gigantea]|uniref:Exocyst complex component Sec3 C-terminal domain-containing protein n=1 Tax=Carnegiea gigantea TaxID=171969 RepID=A0A9Q1KCQ4_9CARY|nr:LOW QUALITY PROTEIN: hypothetical protein Cgig2_000355 [Carnegiea gigantea]